MYETCSLPAKLSDTKRRVLELVRPSGSVVNIHENLAEALHFIHAKDIIHCGLKSDNVVLISRVRKLHVSCMHSMMMRVI